MDGPKKSLSQQEVNDSSVLTLMDKFYNNIDNLQLTDANYYKGYLNEKCIAKTSVKESKLGNSHLNIRKNNEAIEINCGIKIPSTKTFTDNADKIFSAIRQDEIQLLNRPLDDTPRNSITELNRLEDKTSYIEDEKSLKRSTPTKEDIYLDIDSTTTNSNVKIDEYVFLCKSEQNSFNVSTKNEIISELINGEYLQRKNNNGDTIFDTAKQNVSKFVMKPCSVILTKISPEILSGKFQNYESDSKDKRKISNAKPYSKGVKNSRFRSSRHIKLSNNKKFSNLLNWECNQKSNLIVNKPSATPQLYVDKNKLNFYTEDRNEETLNGLKEYLEVKVNDKDIVSQNTKFFNSINEELLEQNNIQANCVYDKTKMIAAKYKQMVQFAGGKDLRQSCVTISTDKNLEFEHKGQTNATNNEKNTEKYQTRFVPEKNFRNISISNLNILTNESYEDRQEEICIKVTEVQTEEEKGKPCNEPFLQHLPCFKLRADKYDVSICRECRRAKSSDSTSNDIYCRFLEFRRLKYDENGKISVAGFPNPFIDPKPEDIFPWRPDEKTDPTAGYMDIQVCRYILLHVGDQFCYLWRQEAEALELHENIDDTIAWKKAVKGVREICDVCETTLFNYHWTCAKCGFGVCIDCFKDRKQNITCRKIRDKDLKGCDQFHWLFCTTSETLKPVPHNLSTLMLTQIIPGDSLCELGNTMHHIRNIWKVPQTCHCLLSRANFRSLDSDVVVNEMILESRMQENTCESSLATKETFRQQLRLNKLHEKKVEFAKVLKKDYMPGRIWEEETISEDPIENAYDQIQHINFLRPGLAGLRRFVPPKVMMLTDSPIQSIGVPHEVLCNGKLLLLTNPINPGNRMLFQDAWKSGQPVMISNVSKSLNLSLWRPEAFCEDFGDKPNDLINCLNGNLVPNQPMRHFWEGFQSIHKRLLDSNREPMLLKLKDWPPGDDFAEILPTRFSDLMNGLPMPEYTLRTGNLNLASCLPKMFVPPDLGPKMYNAYGSALYTNKGTTNLHLDISDAVNIMVYVGIPKDADGYAQINAANKAIMLGGCDYLTRQRLYSSEEKPVAGALWHIFSAQDADKIRDLLNRVTLENGFRLEPDHDPIHDQNWYLDDKLRARLYNEYQVECFPIVQCLGDAVFIPAGAPHQVQNLHNCIKVAEDFVSPENITHCVHLTHEFRRLSSSHTNHEDKLQIKNIIYHAIKDCCIILKRSMLKNADRKLQLVQNAFEVQATDRT